MSENEQENWLAFRDGLAALQRRLAEQYEIAWRDLEALLDAVGEQYRIIQGASPDGSDLEDLKRIWAEPARALLLDPIAKFHRSNPLQRAVSAVQDYETGLQDLVRQWPRGERSAALAFATQAGIDRLLADGNVHLILARTTVHLVAPWQAWRRQMLSELAWSRPETESFQDEQRWWFRTAEQLKRSAVPTLEASNLWAERSAEMEHSRRKPSQHAIDHRQASLTFWTRQQRAAHSLLHLESEIVRLSGEATQEISIALDSLREENRAVEAELDQVIAWLRQPADLRAAETFPAPQATLASADARAADFVRRVESCARMRLPATLELVDPPSNLPPLRSPWKQVEPFRLFSEFLAKSGQPVALTGLREAESAQLPAVRDIERAREVVAFGLEESRKPDADPAIAEEAARNALALLEHREQARIDTAPGAERHLCQTLAVTLLDMQVTLERSWLGVWAHLTRQTGRRAIRELTAEAALQFRNASRIAAGRSQRVWHWALIRSGWLAPPPAQQEPVENVLQLRAVLEVNLGDRRLPGIYGRLFRLAPVEDPRFLVGREREMAGLADAKSRWQAGAAAAVMVIGSRGSGKTSLLNCAQLSLFRDVEVLRGQLTGRLQSAEELHGFLRDLLSLEPHGDPVAALKRGRRVIMLEEFERIFLRRIGGFEALHEFLRLLDATSANNLWIVSMNQAACRYLTGATRLPECFSMRINVSSVTTAALTQAILQRHGLSGYRLHFEPPPESNPARRRLLRLAGLDLDRQERFFHALHGQSLGVFRSAFELWLDSIERVEGGVVYVRQSRDPDYHPLMQQLAPHDYYLLLAVQQHGSLTPCELALILRMAEDEAWRRLRRLLDLDILEAEPSSPGYRVCPEAARFVNEALYSHNLLPGGKS